MRKRSKPEVLFDVSALASHAKIGSKADIKDAIRVLKYICGYKKDGIKLKINGDIQLSVFVDSSGSIHPDMRGHGGYVISLGSKCYGGPVDVSSSKAKTNGRSILEYELFSLHTMLPNALFLHNLLDEMGFPQLPIIIFEDNKALIDAIKRGPISSGVTKHIASKYYYSKDLIAQGVIELRHCPTALMIADILTKDLPVKDFIKMSRRLCNDGEIDVSLSNEVYERLYANSTDQVYLGNYYDDIDLLYIRVSSVLVNYLKSQY